MRKIQFFFAILFTFYTVPTFVSVAQPPSKDPLQILATTSDTLTARFTLPDIQVRNSRQRAAGSNQQEGVGSPENRFTDSRGVIADSEYTDIYFAGADWTLDVGKPRLPIYTLRLGIPIVGTPIVTVIQARPEIRTVENIRITPDDPIFPSAPTNSRPDTLLAPGFYPTRVVEAIPIGFVRDQRIASLQINPIQYNSATKQLKIFQICDVPYQF